MRNKIIPEGVSIEEFEKEKAEQTAKLEETVKQCNMDLEYIDEYPINKGMHLCSRLRLIHSL